MVLAIQQAPTPLNVTQLKLYLGLLSYYGKFLSTLLAPLYKLLGKDVPWEWSSEQEHAFQTSKEVAHVFKTTCLFQSSFLCFWHVMCPPSVSVPY